MYFSKNSRYVFQKAQCFTPSSCLFTYLKGNEKNLSIKYPKEDLTKPPLRRNIPTEPPVECYSVISPETRKRDFSEQRSRSLISRSKNTSPALFDNGLLPKCESEIQITKLTSDQHSASESSRTESGAGRVICPSTELLHQAEREHCGEIFLGEKTKTERNQEKNEFLQKESPTSTKLYAQNVSANKARESGAESKDDSGISDHQIVHIIIDFPHETDENVDFLTKKSKDTVSAKSTSNLGTSWEKERPLQFSKVKEEKKWRSKSLSKINPKSDKKRFEVHEIEDSGTYVLHLKFRTGVEVVPEREVTTRNVSIQDSTVEMSSSFPRVLQKSTKDVSAVEDNLETMKHSGQKKKSSKDLKHETKSHSASMPRKNPETNDNVKAKDFLEWQQPQFYELPVSDSFEERKPFEAFTDSEPGQTTSTNMNSEFKLRNATEEEKPMISWPTESVAEAETNKDAQLKLSQTAEKEVVAETFAAEKIQKESECESESVLHKEKDKFLTTNGYKNVRNYTEEFELPRDESKFPPTDWMIPRSKRSTADKAHEFETIAERKYRTKKKLKKSALNSKKSKGREKKKSLESRSKIARPLERHDSDVTDFKAGASSVSIKCDKPTYSMKLSAAYPPLLNEAMKRRYYAYRRDTACNGKSGPSFQPKNFEMNSKCVEKISPTVSKKDESNDIVRCHASGNLDANQRPSAPKISDNIFNVANENLTNHNGASSLDSLDMMKKVKKLVDLDLNNAIKIFVPDSEGTVSSVVISKGGGKWAIDTKELRKCLAIQKSEFLNDLKKAESSENFFEGSTVNTRKYLPGTTQSQTEMKLDHSVITFNPDTNKFVVDVEDLQEAIKLRTEESFDDVVVEKLEGLLTGSKAEPILVFNPGEDAKMALKNGDSILVYDEEMQQWKVDYSILEKRQEQTRVEEELRKRSELILESMEKFEKNNMPTIPKPQTKDRKTFDYHKEEWKDFGPEKKSHNKMKSPFKESNAEEIRKKNSDMYENLFLKKNETKKTDGIKSAETKLCKQGSATGSGGSKGSEVTSKDSGKTPKEPEPMKQKIESPASPNQSAEDDNYWEAFLNMNLPEKNDKRIPDVVEPRNPKIRAPPPPPPPTPPTPPKPPVSSPSGPKIEEPKFRIPLPLTGDPKKKKKKTREILPKKPLSKEEKPKGKGKTPPSPPVKEKPKETSTIPFGKTKKKEEPKANVPPVLQPPVSKKDAPKAKSPSSPSLNQDDLKSKTPAPVKKNPAEKSNPDKKKEKETSSLISFEKEIPKSSNQKEPKVKAPSPSNVKPKGDPKTSGKKDKSAADHYISENIVELSRTSKDKNSKIKSNKIETVKLNITADKRVPSKVTEINLNKECENSKETTVASKRDKKDESAVESKIFYKKFEKYKTPFSDPEYEEKSMKIKSDIASNPNLKKLSNWSKTLVLHDIAKPPENIECWLKDETDKMATLLLKVLQEAADGKPRRKSSRAKLTDKSHPKPNPYDNIRKKQETTNRDTFLFKVRSGTLPLENDRKKGNQTKIIRKTDELSNLPAQSAKASDAKPQTRKKDDVMKAAPGSVVVTSEEKLQSSALDSFISRDFLQQYKLAGDISDDIPGPELLKRISNTWKVFPVLSAQMTIFTLLRLFQLVNMGKSFLDTSNAEKYRRHAFGKLFAKYGPIVNVQGPLSGSVILIHKPEHLHAVFDQDASIPVRSVFDSLEQSRREAEDKYLSVGMGTEWSVNTPKWTELRRNTSDPLTKGREKYLGAVEAAGDFLITNIRKNKNLQNYASDDFMDEIKRWSLEGLCNVLFEKSFGFLEGRSKNTSWILEPDKLFLSIEEATSHLSKCERGFQLWRLMATPSAVGLKKSYRTLSGIVAKQIYQAEANLKNKNEMLKENKMEQPNNLTFLEGMLLNDGMTPEEITCNLIDVLLVGTNAMSSSLGFFLYNLAQNVKVQSKLINELKSALPDKNSRLDFHKLNSLKYLHACLKESLRLHVPVPVFYRMLQNDILLSNYIIPKGTYIMMDYRVSSMREQIFEEPERFLPERWLNDEKWIQNFQALNALPVCHGPRADLAKSVMEMQILACAAKIIRNFHVEYQFGEIQGTDAIVSFPDKPLKFNFVERDF